MRRDIIIHNAPECVCYCVLNFLYATVWNSSSTGSDSRLLEITSGFWLSYSHISYTSSLGLASAIIQRPPFMFFMTQDQMPLLQRI